MSPTMKRPDAATVDRAVRWLTGVNLGSSFLFGFWLGITNDPWKEADGCAAAGWFAFAWFMVFGVALTVAGGMRRGGRTLPICMAVGLTLGAPMLVAGMWVGWQLNPEMDARVESDTCIRLAQVGEAESFAAGEQS